MGTILLVSHGSLADGMKEAVNMIGGDLVDIHSIGLKEEMGIEEFSKQIEITLTNVKAHHFLVLTDLKGGSPHTKTLEVIQSLNMLDCVTIISGMNLALVLALSFTDISNENAINTAISEARMNISTLESFEENDDIL